jgi:hypothetical protein
MNTAYDALRSRPPSTSAPDTKGLESVLTRLLGRDRAVRQDDCNDDGGLVVISAECFKLVNEIVPFLRDEMRRK